MNNHYVYYCLIVLGSLLVSCGKNEFSNVEKGNQTKTLYIANGSEPGGIDPHVTTGVPDSHVIMALFEGLTTLDMQTLKPLPGVAESWNISPDGKTYTFHIRKTAKWSDGSAITANDFVFSWMRALSPALGNEFAYMMYPIRNAEAFNTGAITKFSDVGVEALDSHTLEVTLNNPTAYFLELTDHHVFYPVHQKTIEKFGAIDDRTTRWTMPGNIVSNGAFTLSTWEINKSISVVKNTHYWDKENVALNALEFFPIEDQQAEVRAFRTGQVHLTHSSQIAIEKIAYFEKNDPEAMRRYYSYSSYFYLFNTEKPPFDDVRVRKALSMAIDRESLVKNVTKGGEKPLYSFVPPAPNGYQPKPFTQYNVAAARELLAQAGYENGKGFPSFDVLYNTSNNHRKIAVAIQQMLKQNLNIDVQLRNEEWKVYLESQRNQNFSLSRQGWLADYYDPSNFFEMYLSYSGNNHTGWKNEAYDAIVKQAATVQDKNERFALFEKANEIFHSQMPIIPLYAYAGINLVHPSVKNWHTNVLSRNHYKFISLADNTEAKK